MSDLKHKRLLVKFSGESVAGDDEHGIDPKILDSMATSIKDCKDLYGVSAPLRYFSRSLLNSYKSFGLLIIKY